MATHVFPSTYSEDYYRYNQNGGDWLTPSNNTLKNIYAGTTSGGAVYRAYIYVPGQTTIPSSGVTVSAITLKLPIGSEYSSDGRWDVGIMTSAPSKTVAYNTSGFTRIAEDLVAAENTTLTVSIPVATWGDPSVAKYIVIVRSEARGTSYSYKGIVCSSSSYPTVTYTYTKKTWIVSYNANGGTASTVPAAQTKTYGTALTLSSTKPTRANASVTGYKVTFNANGGSCSTASLTSTRTAKYTFSKWNTAANGSGTSYNAGGSYTANAAATLYAQWTTSYTNNSITLPTPSRTGHTFKGWATSSTATSGSFGSYIPSAAVTLYAIWSLDAPTGLIYIDNGTSFEAYEIYIDNGTSWDKYVAYIDNGTSWDQCGG